MDTCFKIKNLEFLKCLSYIDRLKDIEVYRFLEKLIYNEHTEEIKKNCISKLKNSTELEFINYVKKLTHKKQINEIKHKRKNIKENMLENYVIRNNKNKKFLQELNLKIFFKTIPNKNIIIEDGDIVDIIF